MCILCIYSGSLLEQSNQSMRPTIRRWGNSLGLRIPKAFAAETAIEDGAAVDLSVSEGRLIIRPVHQRFELEALLEEVTDENLHAEGSTGPAQGGETW